MITARFARKTSDKKAPTISMCIYLVLLPELLPVDIFVIKPLKIITSNPNIIAKLITNIGHKQDIMQITMIKKEVISVIL